MVHILKYSTCSPEETKKLGKAFSQFLKEGDIVTLDGDLGAGKTVFVQGVAEGLEVDDYVSSPTFTIMNVYEGKITIFHFDAYRIGDPEEMTAIGFEEFIYSGGVSLIEWGKIVSPLLPENIIAVEIRRSDTNPDKRDILISFHDSRKNIRIL